MSEWRAGLEAWRAEHPHKVVRTPRGEFGYRAGAGSGRPVVLLHGGGSTAEAAWAFARALEPECRTLVVDWPPEVRTVDDVMDGVLAAAAAEGMPRFDAVGFSMGGMLAQCLLRERPGCVGRLVLVVSMGPSARYAKRFRKHRRVLSWLPAALLSWASKKAVAKWVAEAASSAAREEVGAVAEHRRAMFESGAVSKASLLSDADVLVDFFSRSFAPSPAEVLIVEAERDRMVDAQEREALRRLYPNARVHPLTGDDHFSAVLAPPSLTRVIREFLLAA